MATGFNSRGSCVRPNAVNITAVLVAFFFAVFPASAEQVSVVALFPDKAMLVIDQGKPKTVQKGETYGGVTLLEADTTEALVLINGKKRRLKIGEGVYNAQSQKSAGASVTLTRDASGHFITLGNINGASVRFLLDTGATLISMGAEDARRAGINYLAGERALSQTANGVAVVYKVRLAEVKLGDITLRNIDGMVHTGSPLPVVLLGMSFLGRLEMRNEGDRMTLTKRY